MVVTSELPKLRSDLSQSRQETAEGIVFVLKDPVTGRYFRFREAEEFIAQQLDGATPLESWASGRSTLGPVLPRMLKTS
jgi:hypothetical protein